MQSGSLMSSFCSVYGDDCCLFTGIVGRVCEVIRVWIWYKNIYPRGLLNMGGRGYHDMTVVNGGMWGLLNIGGHTPVAHTAWVRPYSGYTVINRYYALSITRSPRAKTIKRLRVRQGRTQITNKITKTFNIKTHAYNLC